MPRGKRESLRALDWINFFMADVTTGVGPFLAIYLTATRHWNPASVGIVVATQSIASVIAQAPAGALVDQSTNKKRLLIGAAFLVAIGCIGIVLAKGLGLQIATQILIGVAAAIFPPAVAAISLGLVGRRKLADRVGRNEAFNHTGNVVFAVLAGAAGTWFGQNWIFLFSAALASGTILSAWRIRNPDVDNNIARGSTSNQTPALGFTRLFKDRRILVFTASVLLFHFANAAMLPLVGELLSKDNLHSSSLYMSASIVLAQLIMIPVAVLTGRLADPWGRKPLMLVGFAVLAVRGVLYTLGSSSLYLLSVQCLDGVGAAIFGVLWVIIIADVAKGTGRFNFLQGAIQAALGMGAFLSNFIAGFIVKSFGYNTAFLNLSVIAIAGFFFFAFFMPETKVSASDSIGSLELPSPIS